MDAFGTINNALVMMMRRTLEPFHKGNVGKTSERCGGAHMGFFERIDITLNWTVLMMMTLMIMTNIAAFSSLDKNKNNNNNSNNENYDLILDITKTLYLLKRFRSSSSCFCLLVCFNWFLFFLSFHLLLFFRMKKKRKDIGNQFITYDLPNVM